MIISCKCQEAKQTSNHHKIEIELDLSLLPTPQRNLLSSGEYRWVEVGTFERMVGMRRKVVHDLIASGELISYEIPIDPRTKRGFGSRAFIAVKTIPCKVCCPNHYEIDWDLHRTSDDNKF